MRKVDVAIIGAGSAGLFAKSQVKKRTDNFVIIDGGELGTTCARVGCMPSKVLIQVAEDFHRRSIFDREGIDGAEELSVDAEAAMEHVQDLRDVFVDRTLHAYDGVEEQLIESYAHFTSANTLEVDGEEIEFGRAIIATGSTPVIPAAWEPLRDRILTTDEVFEMEDLPASLAVIGLGAIGLEVGQSLSRLGVDVTGIEQQERIANLADEAVNKQAIEIIGREFPLWLGQAASLEAVDDGIRVICGDREVVVEKVVASLGRRPNLESLSLEKAGVELDDHGIPVFDPETMRIGNSNLFIAGDVDADRPILHEAGHEGRVAGYNAVNDIARFARKTPLSITFCDPNIGLAGAQLDELDMDRIAIGEINMGPVGRALIIGKNRGLLRIYADKQDGRLLGASMICAKGEHLAQQIAWAIQQGLTVFDCLKMPFYHPVMEEALQAALYSVLKDIEHKEELVDLERIG